MVTPIWKINEGIKHKPEKKIKQIDKLFIINKLDQLLPATVIDKGRKRSNQLTNQPWRTIIHRLNGEDDIWHDPSLRHDVFLSFFFFHLLLERPFVVGFGFYFPPLTQKLLISGHTRKHSATFAWFASTHTHTHTHTQRHLNSESHSGSVDVI